MFILSIDTATKSLAVSIIKYNLNLANDINKKYNTYLEKKNNKLSLDILKDYVNLLTDVDTLLENKMIIYHLDVIDLIPNKKILDTSIQERTKSLYDYLNNTIDPLIELYSINNKTEEWIILLENQMSPNKNSNIINSQLIYHFSKYPYPITLVGPTLKNKIIIGGKESEYSSFLESHNTNYAANKSHSRSCLLKLLKYLKKENILDKYNIKKKNVDDIADSVLQGLSFVIKYKSF